MPRRVRDRMKLIERYIFRRILGGFLLSLIALSLMVWLATALKQFNLVTEKGQSLTLFLSVTLLLLPALVIVICPVALLIAVIYTLNSLNNDSELVVINASGASQVWLLRPVLAMGLLVTALIALATLYFSPLALRTWDDIVTDMRSTILSNVLHAGSFMTIADGLTFHIRARASDGTLEGIFMFDDRERDASATYLAQSGAIVESPLGQFLTMSNGTIQRRSKSDNTISIIDFTSYAIDLSNFSSPALTPDIRPNERTTAYVLHPDPQDRYFQKYPGKFRADFIDRLATPLYALVFAVVPLVFLGQAGSTRQSRAINITAAVWTAICLRAIGFFMPGLVEESAGFIPLMLGLPIVALIIAIVLVLFAVQPQPPDWLVDFGETVFGRTGGKKGAPAQAAGGGARSSR
jgi:lipopolysaccharide export system permease protein